MCETRIDAYLCNIYCHFRRAEVPNTVVREAVNSMKHGGSVGAFCVERRSRSQQRAQAGGHRPHSTPHLLSLFAHRPQDNNNNDIRDGLSAFISHNKTAAGHAP